MPKLRNVPYEFKNETEQGVTTLTLSGTVRKKWWDDDECIDSLSVQKALEGVSGDIVVKLNSPGGDVFEGVDVYNYLKNLDNHVTIEVTGVAASAASIIAMGADKIVMNTGTSMMIHEASSWAYGNKQDVQKVLNALEAIDSSIVDIYVERTGNESEQVKAWLSEEKWFTAEQAVEHGFANEMKRSVSEVQANLMEMAELKDAVNSLREEIAELKQSKVETPEETPVVNNQLTLFGGKL